MDDCDWLLSVEKACDWLRIEPGVTGNFLLGGPVSTVNDVDLGVTVGAMWDDDTLGRRDRDLWPS